MQIEKIQARKYYGKHAIGMVILINGIPSHFTNVKDANSFINLLTNKSKHV
jgi:hypothetical protein